MDANPLLEEALDATPGARYESTPTRVLSAEHLVAICVQTGRARGRQRVTMFLEHHGDLDRGKLDEILKRHGQGKRI